MKQLRSAASFAALLPSLMMVTLITALLSPPVLAGQGIAPAPSFSFDASRADARLFDHEPVQVRDQVRVSLESGQEGRRTYWREGAVAGGVLFGALGFLISQLDTPDSGGHVSTVGLTLGGVALGAFTGALVGHSISHGNPEPEDGSSP